MVGMASTLQISLKNIRGLAKKSIMHSWYVALPVTQTFMLIIPTPQTSIRQAMIAAGIPATATWDAVCAGPLSEVLDIVRIAPLPLNVLPNHSP